MINYAASKQKEVKVVLLGTSGVGKSSILSRFCSDEFKINSEVTLGTAFKSQFLSVRGQEFNFQIWDTAGQEKYKSLAPMYYRCYYLMCQQIEAQVALIVYDISNKESFEVLKVWVDELKLHGPKQLVMVMVGNKSDLIESEQVSYDEAKRYANSLGAMLKLTSCKENRGIREMFINVGEVILDEDQKSQINTKQEDPPAQQTSPQKLSPNLKKEKKASCC